MTGSAFANRYEQTAIIEEKKERITAIVQNLKQMDIVSLKLMENNSELLRARDAMEVETQKAG